MTELALKRVKYQMLIHTILQVLLIALLIFMAYHFQQRFIAKGMPSIFYNSLLTSFILQAALFYPIYRFSCAEAKRELQEQTTTDDGQKKALRRQRIYADFLKTSLFLFFSVFILLAPGATFIMSTALFSFLLATLTYLQAFNFAMRRELRQR